MRTLFILGILLLLVKLQAYKAPHNGLAQHDSRNLQPPSPYKQQPSRNFRPYSPLSMTDASAQIQEPWHPKRIPHAPGGDRDCTVCGHISVRKCVSRSGNNLCVDPKLKWVANRFLEYQKAAMRTS
ncbi:hypothetical protein Aduo_018567 [Ancylostoma duodenale]